MWPAARRPRPGSSAGLGHTYVWVRYACFYPVLGPFCTVLSPFFRAARLPGAKTERTRQTRRKMGEKWPKSWCRNPRNHTYTPPLLIGADDPGAKGRNSLQQPRQRSRRYMHMPSPTKTGQRKNKKVMKVKLPKKIFYIRHLEMEQA